MVEKVRIRTRRVRMWSLSVVLPAHNEEATVESVVNKVSEVLRCLGIEAEIVLVNDGSTDRTGEISRQLAVRVPGLRLVEHDMGRGYGGALKAGFEAATGDWIAFFPTDRQFVFAELTYLLEETARSDIVCGYRAVRRDNVVRKLNALGWNLLVRMCFGYLCRDIDCGFKLFRREILQAVRLDSDGAMIDRVLGWCFGAGLPGCRSAGDAFAQDSGRDDGGQSGRHCQSVSRPDTPPAPAEQGDSQGEKISVVWVFRGPLQDLKGSLRAGSFVACAIRGERNPQCAARDGYGCFHRHRWCGSGSTPGADRAARN